ncbi:potassium/sodium hyperpolarization-activated cyclic nucleotide-gated channel 4-like [Tropilaelaps mercedesae]|uniref:Potassium/sodium hyperpolarization-activated cyclic nucleotide-gated channel 4-like n=1 Tax=Tropilaelaps mercedesae TaxID=418985 RepID=A0A1V9X8F9_9ACAR|nr:potassium/sodium hyperpolarization-activated cyclic nucleotide-gated channel 4-like [Tropilaelaps mercedesae]
MPLTDSVRLSLPDSKKREDQCYFTVGVHRVHSPPRATFRSLWSANQLAGVAEVDKLATSDEEPPETPASPAANDSDEAFVSGATSPIEPASLQRPPSSPTAIALAKHPIWGAQYNFCRFGIDKPILDSTELARLQEQKPTQPSLKAVSLSDRYETQSPNPSEENSRRKRDIQSQLRSFFLPSKNRKVTLKFNGVNAKQAECGNASDQAHPWVIHLYSPMRRRWDLLMVLLILVTIVEAPLNVAFFPELFEPRELLVLNIVCDIFFTVDIVLNFWTAYHEKGCVLRQIQMRPEKIRETYLKGWFGVDLLSTVPFDYSILPLLQVTTSLVIDHDGVLVHGVKFLALFRVLRIFRLYRYLPRCQKSFYSAQQWMYIRIVNLGVCMVIVAHWNGCIQYLVNYCLGFPPNCWISLSGIKHSPWWEQWSWSFFNAVSQTFGISFGRGTPETLVDMWFTLWGMMQEVEDYMDFRRFPRALRLKVRDYFEQRYRGHVFNEENILATLSDPLKELVMRHNCEETVRSVPFLAKADPAFVNELVTHLKFHFFQPDDVIVSFGTVGSNMFFIQSGRVTVANEDGRIMATLGAGMYFGELSLIVASKRNATVRARTHCSLLELSRENFDQVLKKFPVIENGIKAVAGDIVLNTRKGSGSYAEHNQDTVTSLGTFIGFKEPASP